MEDAFVQSNLLIDSGYEGIFKIYLNQIAAS